MNIFFADDNNQLNNEIVNLMQQAANQALENEFKDEVFNLESLTTELSVSIVGEEEIKNLNSEFRGIDKITDVLSFPQFDGREELIEMFNNDAPSILLGDVVICYNQAIKQAEEYGTGVKREMVYLFVHSIYHLFGYDHMTDEDKACMRAKEESVMEVLGL